jgi:DNA-binding SARP family transcriptional activator
MTMAGLRVLGRPRLQISGDDAPIGGRPLQLLVRLAASPRRTVSAEQLVHDLWTGDDTSTSRLRVTVSRARDAIGRDHLQFGNGSYRLVDVAVDADEFDAGLTAARSLDGPIDARLDAYDLALSAWHGPAFDGMQHLDWAASGARRLDELRAQALDEWGELLLAAGRHEQVVADLGAMLGSDPLRERRCGIVALAQYRCGRQAEALATIERTRRQLRDELGLHVGTDLAALEHRLLEHDASLRHDHGRADATSRAGHDSSATVATDEIEARLRAALVLIRAGAYDEARTVVDDADPIARRDPSDRSRALLLLARAQLAMSSGDDDPHEYIDEAQRIGRRLRDGRLLARTALTRFGAGVPDDWSRALVDLTEPIPLLAPDAPEQVDLLCAGAAIIALSDASGAAQRLVSEAERVDAAVRSERSRAVLLVARSLVASFDDQRFDQAVADGRSAMEIANRTGDATLVVIAIQALLRVWYSTADLPAIESVIDTLDDASRRAILPFGRVRAELCRATNLIVRGSLTAAERHTQAALDLGEELGTYAATNAGRAQQVLIMWERDDTAALRPLAQALAAPQPASVWSAIAAIAGDDDMAARLGDVADDVPADGSHALFTALAAEVAARHGDARLGAWCRPRLEALGDRVVLVGLGTSALGFAPHFVGLAAVATDDVDAAVAAFDRAVRLARRSDTGLWEGHALAELLDARIRSDAARDPQAEERLRELSDLDAPRLQRRIAEVMAALELDVDAARH